MFLKKKLLPKIGKVVKFINFVDSSFSSYKKRLITVLKKWVFKAYPRYNNGFLMFGCTVV